MYDKALCKSKGPLLCYQKVTEIFGFDCSGYKTTSKEFATYCNIEILPTNIEIVLFHQG